MTRKQAILQAIEILSQDNKNSQLVAKLQELYSEMPLSYWTKESILDCIETYAYEHDGKLPYAHELTSINNLPSSTVIKHKFRISSMKEFFKQYFPHLKNKDYCDKNYFLNIFKNNYTNIQKDLKIKNIGSRQYNKYKNKGTPNYETILKKCGLLSYNDLLVECGFRTPYSPLSVTIDISYSYDDKSNDELKSLLSTLKS